MGEKMRKQKLVSVCAVESTPSNILKYYHSKVGSSSSTHLQTTVRAPINAHNLLMLELYPDSRDERSKSSSCFKLHFMLICYGPNTRVEDMRYNFDQDYKEVEYVDFSGPIGSMRLAFELLQKFPKCKEVVFILNDYNAKLPYEEDEDLQSLYKNWKVDTVRIIQDFSIVEKETVELQSKSWRLDEILTGCQACFPNLKKLEVSIHGTGTNFDKVSNFVARHGTLNGNYIVEIINEKVRCKPKPPPTHKMLTSASTGTKAVSSMELAKIAPIPIDMSIIKQEQVTDAAEQIPVPVSIPVPTISPYLPKPASVNDHTSGIQYPVKAAIQIRDRSGSSINEGITPPPTPPALPVVPYACSSGNETGDLKALCWRNEKGNASQHPLNQRVPPDIPSSSALYLNSKEVKEKMLLQRLQPTTSNSAYAAEIVDDEDVDDSRIRNARNPSPPVLTSSNVGNSRSSSFERPDSYSTNMPGEDGRSRRIAPTPPVISREGTSEHSSDQRMIPYRRNEGSRSRSGSRSRRRDGRSRSRSNSRYSSRSRSSSPSSRRRYYRPRSRDYDRYEGNRSGDYRRRRQRSYSRSRSPSPGPSYYTGGETSRRGGYDDGRDRGSYRRNAKRPYYVTNSRRPRGRGSRGFRGRGARGRGRGHPGNRGGFKPSAYDNGGFFNDPRHHQEDDSYDDEGNEDQMNM